MPAIAIDIAALLPPDARAVVERANAKLKSKTGGGFLFDATHHPHVTLGQHFVDTDRITDVCDRITAVLSRVTPLILRVTGTSGRSTSQLLVVTATPTLQLVHKELMDALARYEVPGDASAFQMDDIPPRDRDVKWVANFRSDSSYERFAPHITIGIGSKSLMVTPFTFTAGVIAVCHLGPFCTCRDNLARWTL